MINKKSFLGLLVLACFYNQVSSMDTPSGSTATGTAKEKDDVYKPKKVLTKEERAAEVAKHTALRKEWDRLATIAAAAKK